ncbi:MAG: carbon starvation protein A [Methanosarcinales archaeon]
MNSIVLALISIIGFIVAYSLYAKFLRVKILKLDPNEKTPSHELEDGVDYVPTNKYVLFGHHFTSIAGLAPIVGPALAVIWGWLPAFLWVFFGTIFIGAVHDFGALVVSLRHQGRSIGDLTEDIVGARARNLFLWVIFFLLLLVLAVFAIVIATLLVQYPESVIPVVGLMFIAALVGFLMYRVKIGLTFATLIGVILMFLLIWYGTMHPLSIGDKTILGSANQTWIILLLIYAFIASILPVWVLLQPRDYINSFKLFAGLALMYIGLFIVRPDIVAPAYNTADTGAPPLWPFLFITIACGAISGFHNLVASGTSAKQLNKAKDAQFIGYGAMLGEGLLSTMAIIATTAGFATVALWNQHYATWAGASGLGPKLGAFVDGAGGFVAAVGIPQSFAIAFVAVVVIAFGMTTLDSATRIQRYIIAEIAKNYKVKSIGNIYVASAIAVITAAIFALPKYGGKPAGIILWPLFGTTNQMLAALGLLVLSLYLVQRKTTSIYTSIPMGFMLITIVVAMGYNIKNFIADGNYLLTALGSILLILALWLSAETYLAYRKTIELHKAEEVERVGA